LILAATTVADKHNAEECVLQLSDDQNHHQQNAENEIESGEQVRPKNLGK